MGLVFLIKYQSHTLICDRIQRKCCNPTNPEILKTLSLLNLEWDMKFYFLHTKSDEVGTTLKHPETINSNVKNLSKRIKEIGRIKRKDKGNVNITLPLPLIGVRV
jgi:hypothetical protein